MNYDRHKDVTKLNDNTKYMYFNAISFLSKIPRRDTSVDTQMKPIATSLCDLELEAETS